MNIGQKIKELRQENNLTQEDLAEQLGVSFQAVSRWENSTTYPDITLLPIIANMFDVTIDYLLDMESYKKDEELKEIFEQDGVLFNEGKEQKRADCPDCNGSFVPHRETKIQLIIRSSDISRICVISVPIILSKVKFFYKS